MNKRPFRFGVQYTGSTLEDWQDFARKAEDLGFSTIVVQDHFGPQLAPLPALVSAAAVTSRIRFGTLVLDNDFRHPAAMAKEAATVDVLTGGRLELGLGAGWMMPDYEKTGIAFDSAADRFARFREAVHIVKGFFSEPEKVSFQGKHYQITDLDTSPKTTQQPHPPILIGGRQKGMLTFAARNADIVSVSMLDRRGPDLPKPPTYAEKVAWVKEAADERFDAIELHINASNTVVTDDTKGALDALTQRLNVSAEDALNSPATLIGSVDAIVERMNYWRETCHVSYFVLQQRLMDMVAPLVAKSVGQ